MLHRRKPSNIGETVEQLELWFFPWPEAYVLIEYPGCPRCYSHGSTGVTIYKVFETTDTVYRVCACFQHLRGYRDEKWKSWDWE